MVFRDDVELRELGGSDWELKLGSDKESLAPQLGGSCLGLFAAGGAASASRLVRLLTALDSTRGAER